MGKQHELLAVEGQINTQANAVIASVQKNFNREGLYSGLTKRHEIFDEEQQHLVQATENKEVQSTVRMQLDFLFENLAPAWDTHAAKEATNQVAKADIIVGSTTIVSDVPATALLALEKKLDRLTALFADMPTLDAATAWKAAPEQALSGVYRTKFESHRFHVEKKTKYIEVSPATDKHQAVNDKVTEDEKIGRYIQTNFSGAIPAAEKAEYLKRLATLQRAVKQARQRANDTEVVKCDVADALFGYLLNV